jgi:magnesium chelatase subunit D
MTLIKTSIESSSAEPGRDSALRRVRYPFAAVVGHRTVKQALLLLAIDPRLKGALIAAESGSAKRTLARAFGSLLPAPAEDCGRAQADPSGDLELGTEAVELPLNITVDRLLGGLDLERTIATGRREVAPGLLAQANGRVLYVNDINLLDSSTATHIAHALDSCAVRVEREGLSAIHDADFMFIGTFNSGEGEPSSLLRDRVGLIVDSRTEYSADEKAEIIDRAIRFDTDPFSFADDFAFETAELKSDIEAARQRLPRVRVSKNHARQISQIAMMLGVEGNRADVFALKAARASAALAGRDAVSEDDLVAAIELVLAPRATTLPSPSQETKEQAPDLEEDNHSEPGDGDLEPILGAIEDVIIQAIDGRVPKDLLSSPVQRAPRPSRTGKRIKASTSIRGRYVRSGMNRPRDARVAIDATLRAAAPFQLSRQAQGELKRKQSSAAEGLNAAMTPVRVKIDPGDLRFKEFKHRSGILFIFAVDASGSMALNRMAQAKGALTRLLQQAYLHRDKVALISFRGERSDVLLAPTRSVELAKRLVDALPAGGGTPLSAGIVKAIDLARLARLRGTSRAMLVLFTDGRANVGRVSRIKSTILEELRQLGALLESEEISTVVVDTKSRFVSSGEGEALARILGARYFYLPRADAGAVYDAIASAARGQREQTDG